MFGQDIQEKHQRAKISYNQSEDLIKLESFGIPLIMEFTKKEFLLFLISLFQKYKLQEMQVIL